MATTSEYTLQDWIRSFQDEMSRITLFNIRNIITDGSVGMIFSDETVLSKYHDELSQYVQTVTYTQNEADFYAYNPRLFAYDIYGIPEMWYMVLYANEMHSALQFHNRRVKFHMPQVLTVMDTIRELERPRYDANRQAVSEIVTSRKSKNNDIKVKMHD